MAGPAGLFSDLGIRSVERDLELGQTLFRTGQRTIGLYQILSGRVRLTRVDRSGRETVLYTAGSGDMIAEASLFSSVYHCDAIASVSAKVRLYPKDAVLAAFERDPDAAKSFTARLARQVMDLAAELGLTHEALYRTLARMAAKGEIKRLDGKIIRARTIQAARSTTNI